MCTNLKHLILGIDFAQRYKVGIDWDINGKLDVDFSYCWLNLEVKL